MRTTILLLITLATVVSSCWDLRRKPMPPLQKVWGYRPVFVIDSTQLLIRAEAPRDAVHPAKIYLKGNLIFQNDLGIGIHVIDNSDPAHPTRIGFIRILGNSEMAIRGNYLYGNSMSDLVVLDISDWQNLVEVKRIKYAFAEGGNVVSPLIIPVPERNVYYECSWQTWPYLHTGWQRDSIYNHNCFNP